MIMSVVNGTNLGSSVSVRDFMPIGGNVSMCEQLLAGSSISIRNFIYLGHK